MKKYSDNDSISKRIYYVEGFQCPYKISTNTPETLQLICFFKSSNNILYYKVNFIYDASIGMYTCGQWYSNIKLQPLDEWNDWYAFNKCALDFL